MMPQPKLPAQRVRNRASQPYDPDPDPDANHAPAPCHGPAPFSSGLVGRADQLAHLERMLRAAAAGTVEPLMLAGSAGCGKSALLAALQGCAAAAGARVMAVCFAPQLAPTPFAALRASIRVEPQWRERLGPDAALLANVLPGLGKGGRGGLSEGEAGVRLHAAFRQLVASLGAPGAPLLLCLDDLQWADAASQSLLVDLIAPPALPHVMIIGAARGPFGAGLPLPVRARMTQQGTAIGRMLIPNLDRGQCGELVAHALGCPAPQCAALAGLLHARSGGNPLFTLQLLAHLSECGLLGQRHEVRALPGVAGLSGLLAARLLQLPAATLEMLHHMACLGMQANVARLARVAGMCDGEVDEVLWPAVRLGLLLRVPGQYTFVHERVRAVAAALAGRRSLPQRHLHIGRVLAHGARGDAVFAAAAHMNRGSGAMDASERRSLVRINLAAGLRAREMLAFDVARASFAAAVSFTSSAAWDSDFESTMALHLALAACEQLCGDLDSARARLAVIGARVRARTAPAAPLAESLLHHHEALAASLAPAEPGHAHGGWPKKQVPMMHINS